MSSIIVNKTYPVAEAERGKFAVISNDTLTSLGYPASADPALRGRYAVFTYNLNPDVINLSGTTLDVDICSVDVGNWDALISSTWVGQPLSADVSVRNFPTVISAYQIGTWYISSVPILPNNTIVSAFSVDNTLSSIEFNPVATFVEVYNNDSSNVVYVSFETATTEVSALTSRGIPVTATSYYSIERQTASILIGSNLSVSDVRVFGHNRI